MVWHLTTIKSWLKLPPYSISTKAVNKPLLRLQPVGDELQQRGELDVVLLEGGAGEGRERLQPGGVRRAARAAPRAQRLQQAVAQHVQRQRRQVLQRLHHGPDQIVVRLDLSNGAIFYSRT